MLLKYILIMLRIHRLKFQLLFFNKSKFNSNIFVRGKMSYLFYYCTYIHTYWIAHVHMHIYFTYVVCRWCTYIVWELSHCSLPLNPGDPGPTFAFRPLHLRPWPPICLSPRKVHQRAWLFMRLTVLGLQKMIPTQTLGLQSSGAHCTCPAPSVGGSGT